MFVPNHFFISYSREQFYFVESLVFHLQKHRLNIWFDVERLKPGSDWEKRLTEGYDSCVGLILVASRASLTSDYVRKEWSAVVNAGKPIYIVLFEPVQLPPELEQVVALIDFRGSFKKALTRLLHVIQQPKRLLPVTQQHRCDRDPLPSMRIRVPTRLPVSLWCIVSVFGFQSLVDIVFLVSTLFLFPQVPPQKAGLFFLHIMTNLLVLVYGLYYGFAFLYRWKSASYKMIRLLLWTLSAGLLGMMAPFDPLLSRNSRTSLFLIDTPSWFHLFPVANVPFLVIGLGMSFVLPHLEDALRWFPTGNVPQEVRRKINSRIKRDIPKPSLGIQMIKAGFIDERYSMAESGKTIATRRTLTYWLHSDATDEYIAHHIQKVLGETLHLSEARTNAQAHLVLLTNRTPRAWIQTVQDISSQAIYLVASSIRIPKEIENFTASSGLIIVYGKSISFTRLETFSMIPPHRRTPLLTQSFRKAWKNSWCRKRSSG